MNYEYIEIDYDNDNYYAILPRFKANTMYVGMKLYKEYTLQELELWN